MKHLNIIYSLMAVCLLLGLPARSQPHSGPIEAEYKFSMLQLSTHHVTDSATMEEFVYYTCADLDLTSQVGAPTLPVKYVRFSVPYNAANITLSTLSTTTSYTSLSRYGKRIYPVPQPIPTDGSVSGDLPLVIDSTIYNTNAYWPSSVCEIVSDGFYLGDNRIVTVAVYPIQYNPFKTDLRFYNGIDFEINYTIGATPGNILVRQDAALRQQERNQVKTFVENPTQVEAFGTEAVAAQLAPVQGDPLPQAQYLIIAPDSLASSFKRLAALKRQKGYTVDVVTVEQIINDPQYADGDVNLDVNEDTISTINDPAGKIRQYLKDAHKYRGTQFVLLGGKYVPYRYGRQSSRDIPTDLYYSSLKSVWERDNDGIYGEDSDFIKEPLAFDVYVGRVPCKSNKDAESYINKLFRYELNPGNGDHSYLRKAFYSEGCDLIDESRSVAQNLMDSHPDTVLVQEIRNARWPKGSDILNIWNSNNFGFFSLHNHADSNYVVSYGYSNKADPVYGNGYDHHYLYRIWALEEEKTDNVKDKDPGSGLNLLNNKLYPAIMYSISCSSMPYDKLQNNPDFTYTFGESFVLGKDYGGPAYLGNTREGFVGSSSRLEAQFARLVNNGLKIGIAESESKTLYISRYLSMVHNLLGDPEFEMWTAIPSAYTTPIVSHTDNSLTISGIPGGDSTIVAISNGATQEWVKQTNANAVFQNVNPNSTVMLYRHNSLPWIAPLVLQNERVTGDRYIIANDVTAGREVDSNRTAGDFIVASGTTYEIEHKGTVSLQPGFKVEQGAKFSVQPSDY